MDTTIIDIHNSKGTLWGIFKKYMFIYSPQCNWKVAGEIMFNFIMTTIYNTPSTRDQFYEQSNKTAIKADNLSAHLWIGLKNILINNSIKGDSLKI